MEKHMTEHNHKELLGKAKAGVKDLGTVLGLSSFFKAFSDPTRMRILLALYESELCVCAIAELLGAEQSVISHQLKKLREGKLVKTRREGKTVLYSLDDTHVYDIIHIGCEHLNEKN
jgi:ArsR family transcriptional regulator